MRRQRPWVMIAERSRVKWSDEGRSVELSHLLERLDAIDDAIERENVIQTLEETGKEIIEITEAQSHRFAGNMLQVMGDKPYIVMSNSAYNSLSESQIKTIENHCFACSPL